LFKYILSTSVNSYGVVFDLVDENTYKLIKVSGTEWLGSKAIADAAVGGSANNNTMGLYLEDKYYVTNVSKSGTYDCDYDDMSPHAWCTAPSFGSGLVTFTLTLSTSDPNDPGGGGGDDPHGACPSGGNHSSTPTTYSIGYGNCTACGQYTTFTVHRLACTKCGEVFEEFPVCDNCGAYDTWSA